EKRKERVATVGLVGGSRNLEGNEGVVNSWWPDFERRGEGLWDSWVTAEFGGENLRERARWCFKNRFLRERIREQQVRGVVSVVLLLLVLLGCVKASIEEDLGDGVVIVWEREISVGCCVAEKYKLFGGGFGWYFYRLSGTVGKLLLG
ncbi:hypothetical protein ACLOJK_034940, partial [Asimina triloba]